MRPRALFHAPRILLFCVVWTSLGALLGCKPSLLPGTKIEDTPENQAVVRFLEKYRNAVQTRSAEDVLKLVASDYWEDGGTTSQEDDYGVEKLERELAESFAHTRVIHLELLVQHVAHEENRVFVDYKYSQRALLALGSGEKWVSHTDVNRLILRKTGEGDATSFQILSGL